MSKIVVKDLVAAHNNWKTDCLELIVAKLNYSIWNNWIVVMAEVHELCWE